MAFAITGFQTLSQNFISRGIASNFYSKCPFLAVLGAMSLGNQKKDDLSIGRPGSGEIISGGYIDPIEQKRLGTVNAYLPRIQRFETSNSKWMGKYDTMPTVGSPTTTAHSQAMQAAAKFCWADLVTPILIWHEDKIRAAQEGTKEGQALSMAQLINEATEVAYQEHVSAINTGIWTGNPSDQTLDLWNAPLGIGEMFGTTNTYGNVDRSDSANAVWRAQVDSTLKAVDIVKILDDANLTKLVNVKGSGVNLLLTNTDLYQLFKRQILASGGVVMQNGLPEMAKMGVKRELLQKDNAYIMWDPSVGVNTVYAMDTRVIKIMFHPQRNLTVSPFVDLSDKGQGAVDADQAFIRTRLMFTSDNPYLGVKYTAIGT